MLSDKEITFKPTMTKHPEILLEFMDLVCGDSIQTFITSEKGEITLYTVNGHSLTFKSSTKLDVIIDKDRPNSIGGTL